jgi:hypothetical protein
MASPIFRRRRAVTDLRLAAGLLLLLGVPAGARAQNTEQSAYPTPLPRPPAVSAAVPQTKTTPAERAAQQQSGLDAAQAKSLLRQKGYSRIIDIEAEPNSLWLWQADSIRNGRRVRVGIDYRGNVLEISGAVNQSCPSPGVRLGVGGFGVGSRLSQADNCAR